MKHALTLLSGVLAFGALPLVLRAPALAAAPKCPLKQPVATLADSLATNAHPTTLKGIVLTRTGQPCAGASVYVVGAPRQLVVTNAQGLFTLPVPAGPAVVLYIDYFGEGASRVRVPFPLTEPLRITLGQ